MVLAVFRISSVLVLTGIFAVSAFAQKGIDTQTEKIKSEGDRELSRQNDVGRSLSWGKGKTQVRDRLPNPYQLNGRRDALVSTIIDTLRDQKIVVDEASSRLKDGVIVTQPVI